MLRRPCSVDDVNIKGGTTIYHIYGKTPCLILIRIYSSSNSTAAMKICVVQTSYEGSNHFVEKVHSFAY